MDFEDKAKIIAGSIVLITTVIYSIWWIHYYYKDCKKVGHTTLYCIGTILK